ncbi:PAS domain S-box-containing protein [Rhizobium sp. PvP099]|nr:PAS domain S-box-containing protein [Rhizobium sp. PvP099]
MRGSERGRVHTKSERLESKFLERACARIVDLPEPAYIKNCRLAYVAVNPAYAAMVGARPEELVGQTSRSLGSDGEKDERKEKECRALVFGAEEKALAFNADGIFSHEIHIERFLTEDDHSYVFGHFLPVGAASRPTGNGVPAPLEATAKPFSLFENGLLDDAIDMLEMGIGIYDRDNVLVYCNSQLVDHFDACGIVIKPGIALEDIIHRAYDQRERAASGNASVTLAPREKWVEQRLRAFLVPYHERIDKLPDGRWMRSLNKRLENGLLIAIRHDVTDFKDQEMLLRSQVAETGLFRAILEDLPAPVFVRNEKHELTYANHAYEQMLGSERENYLGKTEAQMFPWAAERFWNENARVLDGEAIDKSEDMTFPDGSVIPVLTRLRSIEVDDGSRYLVCSRTDVSLIKEAQQKAEKVSQDLQTILSAQPVGIGILDADLVFEYANPAFYTSWDTDKRFDLAGRSYRDFMKVNYDNGIYAGSDLDFDAIYNARIAALTASNDHPPIEIRTHGGHYLLISGTQLTDGKILISHTDITAMRQRDADIRQAQEALQKHGALMRDATSAMSQGLLILHDGAIIFSNDALAAMLEMPADMLSIGKSWRNVFGYCAKRGDLGDARTSTAALREWEASVASGEPVFTSFRVEDRRWIQLEARPTGDDHWLAVFTDVTESKEREADLTRLLNRAEAADRAKSEFLANMSHEIRTPMNGVLGMAELLAKSSLDTRQKTFVDIIVKSGNALLTIINDILDFSKIDAGQMKLRKAPFDPVEAIEDVATLLSSAAADKDIELIVRGEVSVRETVLGDAGRFRQIVTNLVGNAVKFTEKGHVFIDLKSRPIDGDQLMLSIRIEDTGLGIPEEKLRSVFEKFSQVDTSSTRRHEGTGLGLAITSGLVELFGGSVEVESELGRGSVFTVNLPFAVVAERKMEVTLPVSTSGARVLVIDDNAVNRRILTEQLSMWGFETVAAENGAEGLAFLHEATRLGIVIDVVVLDYHMPEMNGFDCAKAIRRDRRFDFTGIVFLTSMDMANDETMFAELNVQAHLMKPARAALLRSTIIDVVRVIRTRRRASGQAVPLIASSAPAVDTAGSKPAEPVAQENTVAPVIKPTLDVLVAEDNEVNQIVFTQILQMTGWLFQIVKNGAEAVEAWQKYDPAVIIMDVSMPVMNGHQATRKIRELENSTGTHVPIIGVTAHALESDRELCFQVGMDDYLSKPISPEALENKIRHWLDGAVVVSALDGN